MNSFRFVDFEPREGVKDAIANYFKNTLVSYISPQFSRIVVEKQKTGFAFTLAITNGNRTFKSHKFVDFESCKNESRNWQVAVVDLLTRDIIKQYKAWKWPT